MLKQQAAETCRVGTFYLTEFEAACQVISFFLGPRRHKAVLRASAGSEELLTRPTSVRASRSRSKHPPTHARVRCERRKVSAADLRCEVRIFPWCSTRNPPPACRSRPSLWRHPCRISRILG